MKNEKRIELKLWITFGVLIALFALGMSAFGQNLNPTFKSVKIDSIRARQDTIWLTNNKGGIAYLLTRGDTLKFVDATGEKAVYQIGTGIAGINWSDTINTIATKYNVTKDSIYVAASGTWTIDTIKKDTIFNTITYQYQVADTTPVVPLVLRAGQSYWDETNHTFTDILENNVHMQRGQEMPKFAINLTGSTIANGRIVYIVNAGGETPRIALADNRNTTAHKLIGMTTSSFPNGSTGYVTTSGKVHELNTSGFIEGNDVFLGITGLYTQTRPTTGHIIKIGTCYYAHASNGIIDVDIQYLSANGQWNVYNYNGTSGTLIDSNSVATDTLTATAIIVGDSVTGFYTYACDTGLYNFWDGYEMMSTGNGRLKTIDRAELGIATDYSLLFGHQIIFNNIANHTNLEIQNTIGNYASISFEDNNTSIFNNGIRFDSTTFYFGNYNQFIGDSSRFKIGKDTIYANKYLKVTGGSNISSSSMVYPGAGIPISTGSAWGTSITNNSTNWNTAYGWGNHANAGYADSVIIYDLIDTTISINVTKYGAVGDSVINDYTNINNAFQNSGTFDLIFPNRYYICNTPIYVTKDTNEKVTIDGHGAIIDFSGYNGNSACITIEGRKTINYPLLITASRGGEYIRSNLSTLLKKGDILELTSSSYESPSHSFYPGEFVVVASISGDTIRFNESLNAGYATTDSVRLCFMADLEIKNITLLYDDNQTYTTRGFLVRYFKNIKFENVKTIGFPGAGLAVYSCYGGLIENCYNNFSRKSGAGYGVDISSCMYINVSNSIFFGSRHGITISAVSWPSRYISANNNYLSVASPWTYAFDTHTGSEFIDIKNNTIFGGINIRGPNVNIFNNTIFTVGDYAISLVNASGKNCDYYDITNNIITTKDSTFNGYGISYNPLVVGDTVLDLNIVNNKLTVQGQGVSIYNAYSTSDVFIKRLNLSGNRIKTSLVATNYNPIVLDGRIGYGDVNIDGGNIDNNLYGGIKFVAGSSAANNLYIRNVNIISGGSSANGRCINLANNNFKNVSITNCDLTTNTNNTAIYVDSASVVFVDKNTVHTSANAGLYVGATVDSLFYNENIKISCSGSESLNAIFEQFGWSLEKTNYYTKTNMQTSGQSQVHWNNITNYSFAPYTVSTDSIHLTYRDIPIQHKFTQTVPVTGDANDTLVIRFYTYISDGANPIFGDFLCSQSRNGSMGNNDLFPVTFLGSYTTGAASRGTTVAVGTVTDATVGYLGASYYSYYEFYIHTTFSQQSTYWFTFNKLYNVSDIKLYQK